MRKHCTLVAWLWIVSLGGLLVAAEPSVSFVSPPQGFVDEETELTLEGAGFEPGVRVALLDGGPYVVNPAGGLRWTAPSTVSGGLLVSAPFGMSCNYVRCTSWAGMAVFDVSDSAQPSSIDQITLCSKTSESGNEGRSAFCGPHPVAATGSHLLAFVSRRLSGDVYETVLQVFEVSGTGAVLPGHTMQLPVGASGLVATGNRGCILSGNTVHVLDLDDPDHPVLAAAMDVPGGIDDIKLADNRAYLITQGRLRIIDLGDPSSPVWLGEIDLGETTHHLAVHENRAYVSTSGPTKDGRSRLNVIDVSQPASPVLRWTADLPSTSALLRIRDEFVLLGASARDVVDAFDSSHRGQMPDGGRAVAAIGQYAYTSHCRSCHIIPQDVIRCFNDVVNISNAAEPMRVVGRVDVPLWKPTLTLAGSELYLADWQHLHVIEVGDPTDPSLAGSTAAPHSRDIEVSGSHVFVASNSDGLRVFDVGDASAPESVAVIDTPGTALGVDVAGNHAYVADGWQGIQVVDVGLPASPEIVATLRSSDSARDVVVEENRAYSMEVSLAGSIPPRPTTGLCVSDVSDPLHPETASLLEIEVGRESAALAVMDEHAYVVTTNALCVGSCDPCEPKLHVVDTTDSADPVLVGTAPLEVRNVEAITIANGNAYIAAGNEGMQVFDVGDPTHPALVGHIDTPASDVAVSENLAYVAHSTLEILRLNPPLGDATTPVDGQVAVEVPPGFAPGPYHVLVTNPGGETSIMHNAFRVCERRKLTATLQAASGSTPTGPVTRAGWRLVVDGDGRLFDPEPRHDAVLLLPDLPEDVMTSFTYDADAKSMIIDVILPPMGNKAFVLVTGPDLDEMESLWTSIFEAGAIGLPRLDDRTYGEFELEVRSTATRPAVWFPETSGLSGSAKTATRYRYVFTAGRLTAARAEGVGVDLAFKVRAEDALRCETLAEARCGEGQCAYSLPSPRPTRHEQ